MNLKPEILYRNFEYLTVNKPNGYLSQKPENPDELSIFNLPELSKDNVHVITRLDRPVSGIVLVSLKKSINLHFQKIQKQNKLLKTYLAIIEGKPQHPEGELKHYLFHNKKKFKSYISDNENENFKAVNLKYKLLMSLDNYSVLSIEIHQGKFHQIRAQLSHIGCPVKGDVKYGARRKNKDRSIHLHAYKIEFLDRAEKNQSIMAPMPQNDNLWKIVTDHISTLNKENG